MDAQLIAKNYFDWLKENHDFRDLSNKKIEIQTPYTDNFGDSISLIIKNEDGKFIVTDEGYTLWNLETHGINFSRKNSARNSLMKSIIQFDAVNLSDDNEIFKTSTNRNLSQTIHEITQVILKIANLSFTNKSTTKHIFQEEVMNYFQSHKEDYNFFPNFSITGKSNLSHKIDYLFIKGNEKKLVKVYNSLSKSSVDSTLASWLDTSSFRKVNYDDRASLDLVVNNIGTSNKIEEYTDALAQYNIGILDFSDKEMIKEILGNVS